MQLEVQLAICMSIGIFIRLDSVKLELGLSGEVSISLIRLNTIGKGVTHRVKTCLMR